MGCAHQLVYPIRYTYQSSDPEGYTSQSYDPEGYTTCGDPVGHRACKVHYLMDKNNSYPLSQV